MLKSSSARAQAPASPRPIGWWARRAVLALVLVLALALVAAGIWIGLPLPDDLVHPRPVPGLVLQDRNGLPLRVVRAPGGERGGWISLADIDPAVPRAFLAAEDRRFFEHHGIDAVAVARAVWTDIGARRVV